VDEGRFIDLIEVDAASRTKVDDTRELLDNVQYAPTRGRYKVYLIDEVHMLSGHSFNALLKTLEEPPPHVKFLLATTDPQKLPVTVLSRCLQFHLKRLSPEQIATQLEKILGAEKIAFDAASLKLLARSADGSMRDALSLLDQAISFGGGKVSEAEVREMLGSIDNSVIEAILEGLTQADASGLLSAVADAIDHNADSESVLSELLLALHRLALLQMAPAAEIDADHADVLRGYASRLTPEDVQLFYQIGLHGRRDIALAPDTRSGLEMTLLRMLAFRPVSQPTGPHTAGNVSTVRPAASQRESASTAIRPAQTVETQLRSLTAIESKPIAAASADSWNETVTKLGLSGLTRELANHCTLDADEGGVLRLTLDQTSVHLLNKEREAVLKQALAKHHGRPVDLYIVPGKPLVETPAHERLRTQTERQHAAEEVIMTDPAVQALQENFSAKVDPGSIRPKS
jgi:DNA polymerase-3 subunit gamma/tau